MPAHAHAHRHSHGHRLSSSSSSSSSKRVLKHSSSGCSSANSSSSSSSAARPLSVLRLEQLSIDVEASQKLRSDVRYVLRVQHRATNTRWSFSRSFDEYRTFQKRLLAVMRQGHVCHAECPWLYSFIDSYFPKSSLFRSSSSCTVTKRQESLAKILSQLHSFVLTRANHTCSVTHVVAEELAAFVGADMIDQIPVEKQQDTGRASSSSLLSNTSTDEESEEDRHCPLCEESFTAKDATSCLYTTVLRCGHEFHDECIISKLNESMSCPVCGHSEH